MNDERYRSFPCQKKFKKNLFSDFSSVIISTAFYPQAINTGIYPNKYFTKDSGKEDDKDQAFMLINKLFSIKTK